MDIPYVINAIKNYQAMRVEGTLIPGMERSFIQDMAEEHPDWLMTVTEDHNVGERTLVLWEVDRGGPVLLRMTYDMWNDRWTEIWPSEKEKYPYSWRYTVASDKSRWSELSREDVDLLLAWKMIDREWAQEILDSKQASTPGFSPSTPGRTSPSTRTSRERSSSSTSKGWLGLATGRESSFVSLREIDGFY